jgi:hypothetical protein
MGTLVAGAPLLAGGPPGWVAYGLLAVGTVIVGGMAYNNYSKTRDQSVPTTQAVPDTARRTCNRPYSVVVHAQGSIIGGTTGSTMGAAPIIRPAPPITTVEALGLSAATFAMLGRRAATELAPAKVRLDTWIAARPPAGFLGQHSAYPGGRAGQGGNRMDLDSYGCTPNLVT